MTIEGIQGTWVQSMSNLATGFAVSTDATYSLSMENKQTGKPTQTYIISGFEDISFDLNLGDIHRSIQEEDKDFGLTPEAQGITGDWIKVNSSLDYGFGKGSRAEFSRQVTVERALGSDGTLLPTVPDLSEPAGPFGPGGPPVSDPHAAAGRP